MKQSIVFGMILAVASIFPSSVWADSGTCSLWFPGSVPLEDTNHARALLDALQYKLSTQTEPIRLCVREGYQTSYIASRRLADGFAAIVVTRYTLTHFSDEALDGALAHELGHIMIGTIIPNPTQGDLEREDQKADAFAIKLVGTESLIAAYVEHTHDEALAARRIARALRLLRKFPKNYAKSQDESCDFFCGADRTDWQTLVAELYRAFALTGSDLV